MSEPAAGPVSTARLRVRYPETDRMGVAWHGHYLAWFEIGRTELMRALGLPYGDLEETMGLYFPVVAAGVRYRESARYDDCLIVETVIEHIGGARIRFAYLIRRESDGAPLASGHTEHAALDRSGRPMRLPADVRDRLDAWRNS